MRLFVMAALAVVMSAGSVSASVLGSFVRQGPIGSPVTNIIEDTNREYISKGAGNVDGTRFEVGDKVELYLDFTSIQSTDGFFGGDALDAANTGGAGYNLLGRGTFTISSIGAIVAGKADFGFDGTFTFYEKSSPGLVPFTSISAADAIIAGSTEIMKIGIATADDFIRALNAPVFFASIPSNITNTFVAADFGLSRISGGDDIGIARVSAGATGKLHDFVGQVNTQLNISNTVIGSSDDKFDLTTDTRLLFAAQVPEPTSLLAFTGLALCGLGVRRRKA